ncbi:uncharacterized protein OCT59_017501 [Rhizophagus irregularis]|uniref:uncharacterized protein n=1 Tax=Rhizophagus irregularis TaxID=588596 RepID=UPI0033338C0E|nr:hypothetical protein OCT59_017501 [Rhizophagus irregularis]
MVKTLSNDIRWCIIYHQLDGFSAKKTALRLYISVTTILDSLVKDKKDWYLDEMLQKAAKERSELLRSIFMYKIGSEFKPEQLVFIDETSKDEKSLFRAYEYSVKNVKVEKSIVFVRGKQYTIL